MVKRRLQDSADSISEEIGGLFHGVIKDTYIRVKNLSFGNKKKSLVAFFLFLLLSILGIAGSYAISQYSPQIDLFDNASIEYKVTNAGNEPVNTDASVSDRIDAYIEAFQFYVDQITPTLNDFVSSTPDVTGIEGGGSITFSGASTVSAQNYSSRLFFVATSLLVVLFTTNLLLIFFVPSKKNKDEIERVLRRLLFAFAMLIAMPYLLSATIQFNNGLTEFILSESGEVIQISDYLTEYLDEVEEAFTAPDESLSERVGNLFERGRDVIFPTSGAWSSLVATWYMLPIGLSLFLFVLIIFQFVIRFIKLYFLAVIYPFIAVMHMNEGSQIPKSYWREWLSTVLHQVAFVLGYRILNDVVFGLLTSGNWGFAQLLIYIASLAFLLGINVIVSQLFGNAFSAITTNLMAAKAGAPFAFAGYYGSKKAKQGVKWSAKKYIGSNRPKGVSGSSSQASPSTSPNILTSTSGGGTGKSYSGGRVSTNKALKDGSQSKNAQGLQKGGAIIQSSDVGKGTVRTEGDWFAVDNKRSRTTSLYQSKEDALSDGARENAIYSVQGRGVNLVDSTNYQGVQNYAQETASEPLKSNVTNQVAQESLRVNRAYNQDNNIDGIATSQIPRSTYDEYKGKPPKDAPRIQKNIVYTKNLKT